MDDLNERLRKDHGANRLWALRKEAADEIEALKHDIERYVAISADHATENNRLREELAELKGQWERMLENYASADARAEAARISAGAQE